MRKKRKFFQTAQVTRQSQALPLPQEELESVPVLLTKNQIRALKIWSESRSGDKNRFIRAAITKALEEAGIPTDDTVFMDFLDYSGLSKE